MSSTARALARSSFREARRIAPPAYPSRAFGRRSYSAAAQSVKKSGDMPWMLLAAGITVPGVYLMWPSKNSDHGGHGAHGDSHAKVEKHEEPADDAEPKEDQEKLAEGTSEGAPDKKDPGSGELDQSTENQSEKLSNKQDSQRVDPTEK